MSVKGEIPGKQNYLSTGFFSLELQKNRAMLELPPFTDMQNCNFKNYADILAAKYATE